MKINFKIFFNGLKHINIEQASNKILVFHSFCLKISFFRFFLIISYPFKYFCNEKYVFESIFFRISEMSFIFHLKFPDFFMLLKARVIVPKIKQYV